MKRFDSATKLETALAQAICEGLAQALSQRARARLAVSGGSTPRALFQRLATTEFAWARIDLFQVDERLVEPTHADSNQAMIRDCLLQHHAAAASFHALPALPENRAGLDVIHLGLGTDGHFASLFPGVADNALSQDYPDALIRLTPTHAPHARVSMSLPTICKAHRIMMQFTGEAKLQAFMRAHDRCTPVAKLQAALKERLEVFYADF